MMIYRYFIFDWGFLSGNPSWAEKSNWSIVESNFRIYLIPLSHFYGVPILDQRVKSFVIFYLLFQSAEETYFKIVWYPGSTKHVKKNIHRIIRCVGTYFWKEIIDESAYSRTVESMISLSSLPLRFFYNFICGFLQNDIFTIKTKKTSTNRP